MEVSLGDTVLLNVCRFGFVEGIGVQCLIGDNVVFQKGLKVFLTVLAEQEAGNPSTELLKRKVGWREDSTTKMGRGVIDGLKQACLREAQLKGAELSRKKLNDIGDFWRRDEETVNTMDDAISAELIMSVLTRVRKRGSVQCQWPQCGCRSLQSSP